MESDGWRQTSYRSWEHTDGRYIVQNYCPREGGTVFTALVKGQLSKWRTLEEAKNVGAVRS